MLPFWYTRKHIEAADFYIILNIPYFLTNRRWNVCSRLKFKITFSNEASRFHPNEIKINRKTLVQTCSNLFKLVQTRSNSFKLVQTCSNSFKRPKNRYTRWKFTMNARANFFKREGKSKPQTNLLPPNRSLVTYHSAYNTDRTSPVYDAIGIIQAIGMRC